MDAGPRPHEGFPQHRQTPLQPASSIPTHPPPLMMAPQLAPQGRKYSDPSKCCYCLQEFCSGRGSRQERHLFRDCGCIICGVCAFMHPDKPCLHHPTSEKYAEKLEHHECKKPELCNHGQDISKRMTVVYICGHAYCAGCIENYWNDYQRCPCCTLDQASTSTHDPRYHVPSSGQDELSSGHDELYADPMNETQTGYPQQYYTNSRDDGPAPPGSWRDV